MRVKCAKKILIMAWNDTIESSQIKELGALISFTGDIKGYDERKNEKIFWYGIFISYYASFSGRVVQVRCSVGSGCRWYRKLFSINKWYRNIYI